MAFFCFISSNFLSLISARIIYPSGYSVIGLIQDCYDYVSSGTYWSSAPSCIPLNCQPACLPLVPVWASWPLAPAGPPQLLPYLWGEHISGLGYFDVRTSFQFCFLFLFAVPLLNFYPRGKMWLSGAAWKRIWIIIFSLSFPLIFGFCCWPSLRPGAQLVLYE